MDSSNSLRRALEEFLKYTLENTRGLKGNIKYLQGKLKEKGIDSNIRNIIFQIFNYLDQYFNENSKHHDGQITETDNEYSIYQTALLLRYLHRIKTRLFFVTALTTLHQFHPCNFKKIEM